MKKFTKFMSLLLAMVMLVGVMVLPASAANVVEGNIPNSNLTWQYDKDSKTLTISGEGEMPDNPVSDKTWSNYLGNIETVVIEDGVTSIGAYAFENCSKLKSVSIPNSVQKINVGAFRYCESLDNVELPDGIKFIAQYLFQGCVSLKTVSIPDSVTKIRSSAFQKCSSLGNIDLPASLTLIEDYAFSGATSMKAVNLPAKVKAIEPTAFNHCVAIEKVDVDANNSAFTSVNGVLFSKDMKTLVYHPAAMGGQYAVPESVVEIADYAFNYSAKMTGIALPNGLQKIGDDVFKGCKELSSIVLPVNLKEIGAGAFYDCDAITVLEIPEKVERLGGGLALDCDNLKSAYIYNDKCVFEGIYTFPKSTTIFGYVGSTADKYARRNGNTFISIDKFTQFEDITNDAWYYNAVVWAYNYNVTAGTRTSAFSPSDACTRAQVVTFLWRASGSPEPETAVNPFNDVEDGTYYCKAVLWAAENRITAGTSATTFSPDATCTRGQIVTFLWRYEGEPEATPSNNPFTDVKAGAYYEKAVLWAAETGVTAGTSATTFSPDNTCTRAQVVTFLYRDMNS